jgi:hypothetical protein
VFFALFVVKKTVKSVVNFSLCRAFNATVIYPPLRLADEPRTCPFVALSGDGTATGQRLNFSKIVKYLHPVFEYLHQVFERLYIVFVSFCTLLNIFERLLINKHR